jgi:hypothetical protein
MFILGAVSSPYINVNYWNFRLKHSSNHWTKYLSAVELTKSEKGCSKLMDNVRNSKSREVKYYSLFALLETKSCPWSYITLFEYFPEDASPKEYAELLKLLDYSEQHKSFINALHYHIARDKDDLSKEAAKRILEKFKSIDKDK